jgi:DNA-binding protein HU-beta
MSPKEFVDAIAKETGYSNVQVTAVLAAEAKLQRAALARGEQVSSPLGKFKPVERKARQARNPKTGEMKEVPARTVVKFTMKKAGGKAAGGKADGTEEEA